MHLTRLFAFAAIAFPLLVVWGVAQETADPIATQLDRARQKYAKDYEQFEKSVNDLFGKKEDAARKGGNKQVLDGLRVERKSFDDDQVVPSFAPPSYAKKQAAIRSDFERAYNAAIKDYVKKRADDDAKKIEDELKEFRNGPKVVAIRRALLGTWTLRVVSGYTTDLIFQEGGMVKYGVNGSNVPYRIDVEAGFVYLGEGKDPDRIKLPLQDIQTSGFNSAGQDTTFTKKK